jgi:hypothetical protein
MHVVSSMLYTPITEPLSPLTSSFNGSRQRGCICACLRHCLQPYIIMCIPPRRPCSLPASIQCSPVPCQVLYRQRLCVAESAEGCEATRRGKRSAREKLGAIEKRGTCKCVRNRGNQDVLRWHVLYYPFNGTYHGVTAWKDGRCRRLPRRNSHCNVAKTSFLAFKLIHTNPVPPRM